YTVLYAALRAGNKDIAARTLNDLLSIMETAYMAEAFIQFGDSATALKLLMADLAEVIHSPGEMNFNQLKHVADEFERLIGTPAAPYAGQVLYDFALEITRPDFVRWRSRKEAQEKWDREGSPNQYRPEHELRAMLRKSEDELFASKVEM